MKRNKVIVAIIAVLMVIGMMAIAVSAEGAGLDSGISSALSTGIGQVKSDFTSALVYVLPAALGIGSIGIVVTLAWRFFKKVGK